MEPSIPVVQVVQVGEPAGEPTTPFDTLYHREYHAMVRMATALVDYPEKAEEIVKSLRSEFRVVYEERDAIGKRYTRQDLIGTPFCIAVDYQTIDDNTVTVRFRDTTEQIRIPISELKAMIGQEVSMERVLEKM